MRTAGAHSRLDRKCRWPCAARRGGALLSSLVVVCAACGDAADESQRAELEARYGPRTAAADTATRAPPPMEEADTGPPAARIPPRADSKSGGSSGERSDSLTPERDPTGSEDLAGGGDVPTDAVPGARPPLVDTARVGLRSPPAGADTQAFDVVALLAEAEDAYESLASLRASFVQVMEVPLLERTSRGVGIWYQKGRDRFRMDFEDPADDEIVADGTYLWVYQPSQNPNQVIRSELRADGTDSGAADLLARILSEARTAYDAQYDGREPLDGVEVHVVTLVPVGRSPYRSVRIWVGTRDRLVRRFQIAEVNESIRTVTLSDLEPNAALADSLFRFVVPPGADVFSG